MRKSAIFITIAVVIVALLLGVISFIKFQPTQPYITDTETSVPKETTNPSSQNNASSTNSNQNIPQTGKISLSTLASHNSREDCWVGYNGKAYDITAFLPDHPGGVNAIARNCGTVQEFQDAFRRQHGTSKAGMFIKVTIYKGDLE